MTPQKNTREKCTPKKMTPKKIAFLPLPATSPGDRFTGEDVAGALLNLSVPFTSNSQSRTSPTLWRNI